MFEKEAEEYFENKCLHSYADTEEELKEDVMAALLPAERKQCEMIWGKVYAEYRRINYRLEKTLFD